MARQSTEDNGQHGCLYTIHALSPIHVGCEEGLGAINAPTMRESITGFPFVPGSSIKGVLRNNLENQSGDVDEDTLLPIYGPSTTEAERGRGGVVFSDAQLLALPVRSLDHLFIWLTCPMILHRLARDTALYAAENTTLPKTIPQPGDQVLVGTGFPHGDNENPQTFIEQHLLATHATADTQEWAVHISKLVWTEEQDQILFNNRFAIVSDALFGMLCDGALEVRTRVKIDPSTGTAAASGPWSEEMMPTETLLYGIVHGRRTAFTPKAQSHTGGQDQESKQDQADATGKTVSAEQALKKFTSSVNHDQSQQHTVALRFGGKSSVGYGRAIFRLESTLT